MAKMIAIADLPELIYLRGDEDDYVEVLFPHLLAEDSPNPLPNICKKAAQAGRFAYEINLRGDFFLEVFDQGEGVREPINGKWTRLELDLAAGETFFSTRDYRTRIKLDAHHPIPAGKFLGPLRSLTQVVHG